MTTAVKKWKVTLATLAVGLLLVACTGGTSSDPTTTAAPPTTASSAEGSETTPATTQQSPAAGTDVTVAGFAAINRAEAEVPGSQAISLDLNDDGSWDVEVLAGDREHEFTISADGAEILDQEESAADSDDVERLAQASVPLQDAITTALNESDGSFDEADLTDLAGTAAWQVDLDEPDETIHIDVASGEVLGS